MVTVISVTNQKGGVGKTTTAINTAYYLAKMGKSTLLIDFDPQGNATSGLGIDKQSLTGTMNDVILETKKLADVIVPTEQARLFLAPSTPELANAEVELAQANRRFSRLKNAIENGPAYDFIIIDSPPSLSLLTVNGLIAARYVLLPVQAEFYALEGLSQLLETMKLVRKSMNPTLDLLGVLPTMVAPAPLGDAAVLNSPCPDSEATNHHGNEADVPLACDDAQQHHHPLNYVEDSLTP